MNEPQDLGRMIAYCGHLCRQYSVARLRRQGYDVTPVQTHTLVYLSCCRRDQEVNQRDLEQELHLKSSTVNGIVTRLAEKGYITRRTSPTDGRCRLISLTPSGKNRVEAFRAVLEETNSRFFSVLSETEQSQLTDILSRIIADLENEVSNA